MRSIKVSSESWHTPWHLEELHIHEGHLFDTTNGGFIYSERGMYQYMQVPWRKKRMTMTPGNTNKTISKLSTAWPTIQLPEPKKKSKHTIHHPKYDQEITAFLASTGFCTRWSALTLVLRKGRVIVLPSSRSTNTHAGTRPMSTLSLLLVER